ncbi:MAG: hypothetical protein GY805_14495 [Chloroflexi bacterium]|nr:hypothetical protein [Chloroflexota bacterium]
MGKRKSADLVAFLRPIQIDNDPKGCSKNVPGSWRESILNTDQCSKIPLDELAQTISRTQINLARALSQRSVDTLPNRLNNALSGIFTNTLSLLSSDNSLNSNQTKYLEYIIRTTCRLFFWLNECTEQFPNFELPLNDWATDIKIAPWRHFWIMATYEITTPIDIISSYCHLLSNKGIREKKFEQIRIYADALQLLRRDIFELRKL